MHVTLLPYRFFILSFIIFSIFFTTDTFAKAKKEQVSSKEQVSQTSTPKTEPSAKDKSPSKISKSEEEKQTESSPKEKEITNSDNSLTESESQSIEDQETEQQQQQQQATGETSPPSPSEEPEAAKTNATSTTATPTKNVSVAEANKSKNKRLYANVTFRERPIFKLYYLNQNQSEATLNRAQKATTSLEEAMNAEDPLEPNAKPANVVLTKNNLLEVRLRGYKIIDLTDEDRVASGYKSMAEYQENLQTELNIFIGNEFQRLQIQKMALKFFLSVFFALVGFLILRQARTFFNNADLMIEEKRESLKPMTFMSETLVSSHALGGLFALFLVIGRVFTYLVVTLTMFAAILGQFSVTRNAMGDLFSKLFSDSLSNLQSLIEFLPALMLAVVLLFLWNLSIKILDLFLKGVRSGRISWSFLQSNRISIVRFWGVTILSIVFFPLILASLFGRFNSPLEIVIIGFAITLCLATLPILISVAAGSFILWYGQIYPGQWIQIGKILGEVTEVSLFRITLVPQEGGRIYVPMFQLLFKSFTEMRESHRREFQFKVQRLLNLEDTTSRIESLFPAKFNIQIQCLSLSASEYHFALFTPSFNTDVRREILSLLSAAHDKQTILLTSDLIEEIAH